MKQSRARKFLLATLILGLPFISSACKDEIVGPADSLIAARALWAATAPTTYTMTFQNSCECGPEMSGPVVVRVRNGVAESRRYVSSGELVDPRYADYWFPTVDALFAKIQTSMDYKPAEVHAEYDAELGYPTRVAIPGIAQEEVTTLTILRN